MPRADDALPESISRLLVRIPGDHNRKVAARFAHENLVNGRKEGTVLNVLGDVRAFMERLGERRAEHATREDIAAFLASPGRVLGPQRAPRAKPLKDSTRAERARNTRTFFRWLGKPKVVEWVKPNRKHKPSTQPEDLLTRQEITRILEAARTTRDKALLALLAESGFRLGELAALRVSSVTPVGDQQGSIRVSLPAVEGLKTGRRSVRLFDCAGILLIWLQEHPGAVWKDSSDAAVRQRWENAPLFPSWEPNAPLRPGAIYDIVKRSAQRAGIRKKVKPHLFRFGAATHDAKRGMPVAAMVRKYGWTDTSKHALYYSRLAESDVEEWELRQRGLVPLKAEEGSVLVGKPCSRCGHMDRPGARFCARCARPLTHEAEAEAEIQQAEQMRRMIAEEIRKSLQRQRAA